MTLHHNQSILEEQYMVIRIVIQDLGVGIPEDMIDKIFVEFGKLDDPQKLNNEGTGLGMSISKRIIDLMHGDISVVSTVNVGTSFEITLRTRVKLPSDLCNHSQLDNR